MVVPVIFVYLAVIEPTASSTSSLLKWFVLFAYVGLAIAYAATVIFGLPVYFLLLRIKKASFVMFGIVGTAAAIVIGAFMLDFPLDREGLVFMVILAVSGLGVSITFRGIAGLAEQVGVPDE